MKRILFFVVGGISLFAAIPILDGLLGAVKNRGYDTGVVMASCSSYSIEGIRSKESFQQQMKALMNDSKQMDRESLMEYLDDRAVGSKHRTAWLKCLWAVRQMEEAND